MKKVAMILSGSGHFDGAELRESILSMLALDSIDIEYEIFAPDRDQMHVINHLSGEVMNEARNVLIESARVARGQIKNITELNVDSYDGLVIPGGFGVAKNYSDFAIKGHEGKVEKDFSSLVKSFHSRAKPICAICIAPAVLSKALGVEGLEVTIGTDEGTASEVEKSGASHINKSVTKAHCDLKNKVVTTPAYMFDSARVSEVYQGINAAIKMFAELA